MAWEEYYGTPEIDTIDLTDYDTIDYNVSKVLETEKAVLYKFHNLQGEAWVPKSIIENSYKDFITLPDWFKVKLINKIKEVELPCLK
jgi:gentisate 1,2-dioxygenase